jgi:multicomponent Na+:H+ antiporter subunit D
VGVNHLIILSAIGILLAVIDKLKVPKKILKIIKFRPLFYSLIIFSLTGLIGLTTTNDFFTFFIFLELALLPSYVWVTFSKEKNILKVSMRYMIIGILGSAMIIMGIALYYGVSGTLEIGAAQSPSILIFTLIIAGLAIKSGILPLNLVMPKLYKITKSWMSYLFLGFLLTVTGLAIALIVFKIFGSLELSAGMGVLAILTWVHKVAIRD